MQQILARFGDQLSTTIMVAAAGLLVAMTAILFTQVIFRYVLSLSLPWSEEVARFLLIWFALLSAAVAAHGGHHFVFRWATLLLPPAARDVLAEIVMAVTVASLVGLSFYCFVYLDILKGLYATATQVDMRLPYAALPVSFFLLALMFALELLDALAGRITGQRFSKWHLAEERVRIELMAANIPPGLDAMEPDALKPAEPSSGR